MDFRGVMKILMLLLPLAFAVQVDGRHIMIQNTTESSDNATREESNYALVLGIDYYEYPEGQFTNESYNDTLGFGAYYYGDYYGFYAYPELEANKNSTKFVTPTSKSTIKPESGLGKPKVLLERKTRSLPIDSSMKHLCVMKMVNISSQDGNIILCKDSDIKHFACLDSNGFIKPCSEMKKGKNREVALCMKKETASYVTTCNSPESQSFCFTFPETKNKLVICNDQNRRVCFSEGLKNCKNQDKTQRPTSLPSKPEKGNTRKMRAVINPPKPDVNCSNCEVNIKMVVDESGAKKPIVKINVSKLDPSEDLLEDSDEE